LSIMVLKGKVCGSFIVFLSAVSLYGVYAFFKRQIPDYMFLKMQFAYFDYSEPRIFFLADLLAVIVFFALLGYGITRMLNTGKQ